LEQVEWNTRPVKKEERIRLWININRTPLLYDMVVTNEERIRLEQPAFLKQPIPRVQE
jgi:hypothetical protein